MTTGTEASKQIERLSGLDFYPHSDKPALRELRMAGESAYTQAILTKVVDDWLGEQIKCPKPAELRRLIHEKQSAIQRAKCHVCSNSGWVIVYKLVTYRPGSYEIKACETLDMPMEERYAFSVKLAENQAILSGAKPCVCLPPDHKYLTGERQ